MKVKRLVAVLLAALLLVGMIPMNALAAFEFGASGKGANDRYRIDVMISKTAPATGIQYDPVTENSDVQALKNNADKANGAWSWAANNEVDVSPSKADVANRVYVGFKATNEQPDKAKGISSFSVVIKYDKKYLSPIRTNTGRTTNYPITKKSDETGAGSVLNGCYVNDLASGIANEGYYPEEEVINDATLRDNIVAYRGAGQMGGAAVQYEDTGTPNDPSAEASGMIIVSLDLKTNREFEGMATVSSTDWDFVVPFYVNQDAPGGTARVEVIPYVGTSPSKVQYTMIDLDGSTKINVGQQGVVFDSVGGVTTETMAKLSAANDVLVNIVEFSETPNKDVPDSAYENTITNSANKPYLSAEEARDDANSGYGPNDFITFPLYKGEQGDVADGVDTGFKVGDTIVVYADKDGNKELGRTELKSGNFYKDHTKSGTAKWYATNELEAEGTPRDAKGMTLRLVDDSKSNGYGYIKNQDTVWIGRLQKDTREGVTGESPKLVVDKSKLIEIKVTPEPDLSYDGDVDVYPITLTDADKDEIQLDPSAPLGSRRNPIKVKLGETVKDALAQVDRLSFAGAEGSCISKGEEETAKVVAPVDGGGTVETTVNWRSNWVAENTNGNGNLFTDAFISHGLTTIKALYDDTEDGVYHQPINEVDASGAAITPHQFGTVIYVKVEPNPAHYLASSNNSGNGTVTILEPSRSAWVEELGNDNLEVYANKDTVTLLGSYYVSDSDLAISSTAKDLTVTTGDMPNAGGYVNLRTNIRNDSRVIVVPVFEQGYSVSEKVEITGTGDQGAVEVLGDSKVAQIFHDVDPVFTLIDAQTGETEDIHLMDLLQSADPANGSYESVFEKNNGTANLTILTPKSDDQGHTEPAGDDGGYKYKSVSDYEQVTHDADETVTFIYKIPAPQAGTSIFYAPGKAEATYALTQLPDGYGEIEYANPQGFDVEFKVTYIDRITLSDGFDNSTIVTKIVENNPLGEDDVILIQGDKPSSTSADSNVKVSDTVSIFDRNDPETYPYEPIATGTVTEIMDGNNDGNGGKEGTKTYKVTVPQLGRTIDLKKQDLTYRISRTTGTGDGAMPDVLPSLEMRFSAQTNVPQEPYIYDGVVAYNPSKFTYDNSTEKKTDVAEIVKAVAPTTVTLKYGYSSGKSSDFFSIDEATKGQITIDLPDDNWTTSNVTSPSELKGDKNSVYTLNLTANSGNNVKVKETGEGGNEIELRANKTSETLTIQVEVVEKAYNGPSVTNTIAKAIKVTNNRYPTADEAQINKLNVTFDDKAEGDQTLTVYLFASEDDAKAMQNAIAIFKDLPAGEYSSDAAVALSAHLKTDGDKVYVRAQASGAALSGEEDIGEVVYGGEDYTFWGVDITSEKVIELNRKQIKFTDGESAARSEDDQVAFIKSALTSTYVVTAVRFIEKDGKAVPDLDNAEVLTVSKPDLWKEISKGTLATILGTDQQADPYPVTATFNEGTLSGVGVSKVVEGTESTEEPQYVRYGVKFALPAGIDRDESTEKVTVTLLVSEQAEMKFEVPAEYNKYIKAERGKKSPAGDKVTFDFSVDGDAKSLMASVEVEFTIKDTKSATNELVKVTGKLDADGKLTIVEPTNFNGFTADTEAFNVIFTKTVNQPEEKKLTSTPIPVKVPALTSGDAIIEVVTPIELKITTGSILIDKDLTDLVTGGDDNWSESIESVQVKTENGGDATQEVALATTTTSAYSSAYALAANEKVVWKLWIGGADIDFDDTEHALDDGFADALASVDEGANYALIAQLDTEAVTTANLTNDEEHLAIVPITLYDRYGDDGETFPLTMSEGNSDLYHSLKPDANSTLSATDKNAATAEIGERNTNKVDGKTDFDYADFKYDAVFYYRVDAYDTTPLEGTSVQVKPYVTATEALTGLSTYEATVGGETDFAAWLAKNGETDVRIEERIASEDENRGLEIKELGLEYESGGEVNVIEPHHSDTPSDYFDDGVSYTRGEEDYVIRYKVRYNGAVYVMTRKVRLTYKPGDANLDLSIDTDDVSRVLTAYYNASKPFVGEDAKAVDRLNARTLDVNKDIAIDTDDAALINTAYFTIVPFYQRW